MHQPSRIAAAANDLLCDGGASSRCLLKCSRRSLTILVLLLQGELRLATAREMQGSC